MMDINKETISRLKFIGKIQIGDKVNLRYMYIQPDGLLTQISRSLLQDNRNKTLSFLQDTINKTFEIFKFCDTFIKSVYIFWSNLFLKVFSLFIIESV